MIWNIYSVGDAFYLQQILNATAAICGTANFETACAIAMLVGLLIVAFQIVINNRGFNVHHILICFVFWLIAYYPTITVNIHDVYTQQDRKVDNVPLGVGFIGSVVSTLGFKVTEMMETAYQMPESTTTLTGAGAGQGGKFGDSLYLLNNIIRMGTNGGSALLAPMRSVSGDYKASLENYVRDCTFKAFALGPQWGGKSQEDLHNLPVDQALAFLSNTYYTRIYVDKNTLADKTCKDAWNILYAQYDKVYNGGSNQLLAEVAHKAGMLPTVNKDDAQNLLGNLSVPDKIAQITQSLRLDTVDNQKFILGSFAYDIYRSGMARGYRDYYDNLSAVMINNAIMQRNTQWAAEQSMFFNSIRPMMAFIEGFVYAITPFAGFIMLLGMFGLSLFFKYMIMMIWIQLWLPVISIANMFVIHGATKALTPLALRQDTSISSFYAIDNVANVTGTWIATGAMFTAATPLLTFIIISGSAYALTSLTGRMAGSDHVNEKILSPDAVASPAVMSMQSMYNADSMKSVLSGAQTFVPTVNLQSSASNALSVAQSETERASHAFSNSLSHALNHITSQGANSTFASAYSQNFGASIARGNTALVNALQKFSDTNNLKWDETAIKQLASSVSMGLSLYGSGAKVSGTASEADGEGVHKMYAQLKDKGFQWTDSLKADTLKGLAATLTDTNSINNMVGTNTSIGQSLQDTASKLNESARVEQMMNTVNQSVGSSNNVDLLSVVSNMTNEQKRNINAAYESFKNSSGNLHTYMSTLERRFDNFQGNSLTDAGSKDLTTKLLALHELGKNRGATESLEANRILLEATSNISGFGKAAEFHSNTSAQATDDQLGTVSYDMNKHAAMQNNISGVAAQHQDDVTLRSRGDIENNYNQNTVQVTDAGKQMHGAVDGVADNKMFNQQRAQAAENTAERATVGASSIDGTVKYLTQSLKNTGEHANAHSKMDTLENDINRHGNKHLKNPFAEYNAPTVSAFGTENSLTHVISDVMTDSSEKFYKAQYMQNSTKNITFESAIGMHLSKSLDGAPQRITGEALIRQDHAEYTNKVLQDETFKNLTKDMEVNERKNLAEHMVANAMSAAGGSSDAKQELIGTMKDLTYSKPDLFK